mmetsp:Transcript_6995/g.14011  ORF Transcript_6995/g.14011 Transcript_6995/m.14011 type:complete len:189 (+) Transcript_6995:2-568(+)
MCNADNEHMKRVDAARLFYLHRFGGTYMDLDFACLRPLDVLPRTPGMAIFGYQLRNNRRGPYAGNVANAFMAAPPGHPFISYAISKLRSTSMRDLLHATGPMFLSRALGVYLRTVENRSIVIHTMPRIYASQWNKKNPCGRGSDDALAKCTAELPDTVVTTFWTNRETWKKAQRSAKKRRKDNMTYLG